MNRTLTAIKEWLNPNWAHHQSVPPLEGGLRPNTRLDEADVLVEPGDDEPDDVLLRASGAVWFTSGPALWQVENGERTRLAEFGGHAGTLAEAGGQAVVAVAGTGLVTVDDAGRVTELCTDDAVANCVTDLAALPDGSLLASVGSEVESTDGWARALVDGDRTGRLVRVDGSRAEVIADGLAWPSGVAPAPDGDFLLAQSMRHRIERRSLARPRKQGTVMFQNLPVYPGRITPADGGWWIAAPYARNRVTELFLDEPELLADMVATIKEEEWFVPRLRSENPFTDPLQMGQMRVLGVIKPWAPPRSYGVVFRLDHSGLITTSAHSRVDGKRHGVTGVSVADGRMVLAARGHRAVLELRED
jgi:hypothetical protein